MTITARPSAPALNSVSLRQLEYVVAVADTLGFRRAAERCSVSQPTLSAQIRLLEDVLGVAIFERDRRRVLVTPAGSDLVARARRVLLEASDLLAAATRARDPFVGTFRVGVIPTIAPYYLPEVTEVLARAFPRLSLVFREGKTADTVRDLAEGTLDAGLVALEADLGDLEHAEIFRDRFVVALAPANPLARSRRARVPESALAGADVLLLEDGHCLRSQTLAVCAEAGARETGLRATSLATLVQMVARSDAVTLLPELAVPVENRRGQLAVRSFSAPEPYRTIALVWRRGSPLGAALRRTAEVLGGARGAARNTRAARP